MGKKKGKKTDRSDNVAGEDNFDVDALAAEIDGGATNPPKAAKSRKKKADDNWEDDVLNEIAELSLDPKDKNNAEDTKTKDFAGGPKTENTEAKIEKSVPVSNANAAKENDEVEFEFFDPGDDEKKKKKKRQAQEEPDSKETEESSTTVKTKAQKQAEKKEREKKKKEQQKSRRNKEKNEQADGSTVPSTENNEKDVGSGVADLEDVPEPDEGEATASSKKKDKKKKKAAAADEKDKSKTKKKPNKAMIKAMQEQLNRIKEEEERRKKEEEEEIRKAEEAEKSRLQKLEEEKLKKERKKQKEKERIQRLKKEGKYLTPAQKEAQRRREAYLASLREQGLLPTEKEGKDQKKPRYDRKRQKKQESEKKPETEAVPPEGTSDAVVEKQEEKEAPEQPAIVEEEDDVVDDWEAISEKEWDEMSIQSDEVKEEKPESKQNLDDDEEDEDEEDEEEEESEEESSDESEPEDLSPRERAIRRIHRRKEKHEANRSTDNLRSPVICVMGHVDTGKTKILDKIRHSQVQEGEAGGITQQIGATFVPSEVIQQQTKMVKSFQEFEIGFPGLLIIDTPGHESFSNLRSRGSSLCDMAILVVDVMHGLESQTLESIAMLKKKKTPFVVALNKVDRLYDWKRGPDSDIVNTMKKQKRHVKDEFDERLKDVIVQFATQNLNVKLFYENDDPKEWISMVPTSAHSGDGMGNLISLVVELCQTMLAKRLSLSQELECTVLEVKAIQGLGTTIDVILTNGELKYGETIVVAGVEGPIVTHVKGLLMPQPLKELRVKNPYDKYDRMMAAQGIKILAKDLDKALAGTQMLVAHNEDEIDLLKEEVQAEVEKTLKSYKLQERGVFVQASTLGSLEALLAFLDQSKIPYAGISIGPVHKKDIMKTSVMLEHDSQWAVVLAFDVKVEREAQELADSLGVKIFTADIIYHLFDSFMQHREDLKKQKQDEFRSIAVFPCKLRIMQNCVFKSRDPIIIGVNVEAGQLRQNTPICVPSKEFLTVGYVTSMEFNHKSVEIARTGQEVCIKIEGTPGEPPKMVGRHFDETDILVSKISRESINALKDWFRDEMQKPDWQLTIELKKLFDII